MCTRTILPVADQPTAPLYLPFPPPVSPVTDLLRTLNLSDLFVCAHLASDSN